MTINFDLHIDIRQRDGGKRREESRKRGQSMHTMLLPRFHAHSLVSISATENTHMSDSEQQNKVFTYIFFKRTRTENCISIWLSYSIYLLICGRWLQNSQMQDFLLLFPQQELEVPEVDSQLAWHTSVDCIILSLFELTILEMRKKWKKQQQWWDCTVRMQGVCSLSTAWKWL